MKWTTYAIKTILTNELYLGHLIQGKRTTVSYKNHKIRNKDKSERIRIKLLTKQSFMKKHLIKYKLLWKKELNQWVQQVLSISSLVKYLSWMWTFCYNNRDGYDDCENKTGIRYDELSNLVLDATNKKIKKFYDEEELENLNSEKVNTRFQKKIKSLEKGLTDIQNKISKTSNYLKNIYENKVNGVITPEQFKDLITNYNKEIFSKYQELAELNIVIAQEFIDKIYIGKFNVEPKSRDIQIKWNF